MKEFCETLREAFEELVREFSIEIFDDLSKTQSYIRDLLAEHDAERKKFELLMKAGGIQAMLDALGSGEEEQRAVLLTTARRIKRDNMTTEEDARCICESFAHAIGCAVPEKVEKAKPAETESEELKEASASRTRRPIVKRGMLRYEPTTVPEAVIPEFTVAIPGMTFKDAPEGKIVERYDGMQSVVTIPDSIGGVPVIGIAPFAFAQERTQQELLGVQIPPTVTSIGEGAFMGCAVLEEITMPTALQSIGARAFAYTGLYEVRFPEGVKVIGDYAFEGCTELRRVFYPAALERIGDRAFCGCSELESGGLPESVISIGRESFCGCESLQVVSGASELDSLGYRAFAGCSKLHSVNLPATKLKAATNKLVFEGCIQLLKLKPGILRRAITKREKTF